MIWRNLASNLLTLLVVGLMAAAAAVAWGKRTYDGAGPATAAICVQVPQGASLSQMSQRLAEQGAIRSAYVFRAGMDAEGLSRDLKFGSYLVRPGASMADIARTITQGGPSTCGTEVIFRVGVRQPSVILREIDPATGEYAEVARSEGEAALPARILAATETSDARLRLQVAEGTTTWQVVEALKAIPFLAGEPGEVPPEGTLAPDTYAIEPGQERAAIVAQMRAAQDRILAEAWAARTFDLPYETPEEALIMASIVEKETGVAEERRTVAGVFVNRLREGMRLETDPSVIYGVTQGREVLDRGLRRSELQKKTDWNTYQIDGLPKTPIANPGRAAIEAALDPEATDYIFFVADGTGGHAFAATLEEHNANVARWREIEAQRGQEAAGGASTGAVDG